MTTHTDTATRITLTCDCQPCEGRTVTANIEVLAGATTTKARREVAHTYVQYVYGTSPLAAIMCGRYDVRASV